MTSYAAFLRGINVGGRHMVSMTDLRREFNRIRAKEIKTILNSGNVRFSVGEQNIWQLEAELQTILEKAFGFHIPVIIRTMDNLKDIVARKPFDSVNATPDTHFYLSFLKRPPKEIPPLPIVSEDGSYSILSVVGANIFSVLNKAQASTPKVMELLEKTFGKEITTRRWDTVIKVIDFK